MSTTLPLNSEASPAPRPARRPPSAVAQVLKPFASLQATVVLFAFSVLLVFFGTLAQMNEGIWTVVNNYFWSWIAKVDFQLIVVFAQKFDIFGVVPQDAKVSGWFPLIGGKLLGLMLLVNLLAAHLLRFKLSWKRSGVIVLHSGLILLFVGEFITREYSIEQRMTIDEGSSTGYAWDTRNFELAFVNGADPAHDHMVVVPFSLLQKDGTIADEQLPVDVQVVSSMVNSSLRRAKPDEKSPATTGLGLKFIAEPKPEVSGVQTEQSIDIPAAYVKLLKKGTEESLGTYLVTPWFGMREMKETVEVGPKTYDLGLRFTRYYKPFDMTLVKFRFDRYIGTSMAKNFSSEILLNDPERGVKDRRITISMNDPFRYRGETFYQADFDKDTEKTTILQVVRNPGWFIPYLSCVMVALGMLLHFGITLAKFLNRITADPRKQNPTGGAAAGGGSGFRALLAVLFGRKQPVVGFGTLKGSSGFERALPWICLAFAGVFLLSKTMPPSSGTMNLNAAGELPVVDGGRVKPLDSVARLRLRLIANKEEYKDDKDNTNPAIRWYFETASDTNPIRNPGQSARLRLFRIDNDQVRDLLKLEKREGSRYSFAEIRKQAEEMDDAVMRTRARPEKERDLFDAKLLELQNQCEAYVKLAAGVDPSVLPPTGEKEWRTVFDAGDRMSKEMSQRLAAEFPTVSDPRDVPPELRSEFRNATRKAFDQAAAGEPGYAEWQDILMAYRDKDAERFNKLVAEYRGKQYPTLSYYDGLRVKLESFLNVFAPFYHAIYLYVLAFLLTAASWVALTVRPSMGESLRRSAFFVLLFTFSIHALSLLARMYLMDRPLVFVTNLYSSAVFIGAGVVAMCLVIERVFPIGLGNAVAAALGGGTCIVAHNLAASGDTLEMMQAVLDTNFWLATHVTTVTLGYAATYVAGAIGLGYLLTGMFTPALDSPVQVGGKPQSLGKLIGTILYAVICFATMLSFVGTVLGGIWADQSWGRFWGWDPKENGAVLIVAWNALILHARWCGLVKDRGIAVLALFGNIITTWSWFGTNQLGVGLHAYGFNKTLKDGCTIVWLMHLLFIAAGMLPQSLWRSTGKLPPPAGKPLA